MTLEEVYDTAKETVLERISNPLLGSFLVAWCIWNWRFLVILFSNTTASQTFTMVDRLIFPDLSTFLTHAVIYPLLSAAFYIFIYPYPAQFVYGFTLRRQRETHQIKQKIADETPLTMEDSVRLRAHLVEQERKHAETLQGRDEEIARLEAALAASFRQEENSDLSNPSGPAAGLPPGQLLGLHILASLEGPALKSRLLSKMPELKWEDFHIEELEQLKLIRRNFDYDHREDAFELTDEGHRIIHPSTN